MPTLRATVTVSEHVRYARESGAIDSWITRAMQQVKRELGEALMQQLIGDTPVVITPHYESEYNQVDRCTHINGTLDIQPVERQARYVMMGDVQPQFFRQPGRRPVIPAGVGRPIQDPWPTSHIAPHELQAAVSGDTPISNTILAALTTDALRAELNRREGTAVQPRVNVNISDYMEKLETAKMEVRRQAWGGKGKPRKQRVIRREGA